MSDPTLRNNRQFERLLSRTNDLSDINEIKRNLIEIDKQLTSLRENHSKSNQILIRGYEKTIEKLRAKVIPHSPKKNPQKTKKELSEEEILKQETAQHDKLIEELLHSTEKMKKNSLQITNQMALDEEIMKQVHETVDHVSDSVASANKDLKIVTNEPRKNIPLMTL